MSKIQNLTIPMFITNKDTPHIIAQANSGSGKSAAFVIGACVRLSVRGRWRVGGGLFVN